LQPLSEVYNLALTPNTTSELVLDELKDKTVRVLGPINAKRVTTFTLNDTVVIVHRTDGPVRLRDVQAFGELIRRFAEIIGP
jgi:hypothetical protein